MTTCEIPLTRGAVALVDAADFARFGSHKWYLHSSGYAARRNGSAGVHILHRAIAGVAPGVLVRQENGNKLDCRRSNLKVGTRSQLMQETGRRRGPRVGRFKGVSWNGRDRKWLAQIHYDAKDRFIGYYGTEEEAAAAYDRRALAVFGSDCYLNCPNLAVNAPG